MLLNLEREVFPNMIFPNHPECLSGSKPFSEAVSPHPTLPAFLFHGAPKTKISKLCHESNTDTAFIYFRVFTDT